MTDVSDRDLLKLAARRARDREFYLASAFREYQTLRQIDDPTLAKQLGCDLGTLDQVRLCRRPAPESQTFRTDVQAIAQRFGVTALALVQVLREVSSLDAMRSAEQNESPAVLIAARDRKHHKPKKGGHRAP